MTNEKFTPGRFRRAFNMSRNGKTVRGLSPCRIENEKGVVIAFTVPQKSRQEQIANTNLLATVKDLYKALYDLVGNCRPGWQEVNVSRETIDNALEALKKARGEE